MGSRGLQLAWLPWGISPALGDPPSYLPQMDSREGCKMLGKGWKGQSPWPPSLQELHVSLLWWDFPGNKEGCPLALSTFRWACLQKQTLSERRGLKGISHSKQQVPLLHRRVLCSGRGTSQFSPWVWSRSACTAPWRWWEQASFGFSFGLFDSHAYATNLTILNWQHSYLDNQRNRLKFR